MGLQCATAAGSTEQVPEHRASTSPSVCREAVTALITRSRGGPLAACPGDLCQTFAPERGLHSSTAGTNREESSMRGAIEREQHPIASDGDEYDHVTSSTRREMMTTFEERSP